MSAFQVGDLLVLSGLPERPGCASAHDCKVVSFRRMISRRIAEVFTCCGSLDVSIEYLSPVTRLQVGDIVRWSEKAGVYQVTATGRVEHALVWIRSVSGTDAPVPVWRSRLHKIGESSITTIQGKATS